MESDKRPKITIKNCGFSGAKDGVLIKGDMDVNISDSKIDASGGTAVEISNKNQGAKNSDDKWYKKPIGMIVISVVAGLILAGIISAIKHFWPIWFN